MRQPRISNAAYKALRGHPAARALREAADAWRAAFAVDTKAQTNASDRAVERTHRAFLTAACAFADVVDARPDVEIPVGARRPRRLIGGVSFACLSPGSWLSLDGKLAIVHMMVGSPHEAWELYVTQLGGGDVAEVPDDPDDTDFLCWDHICSSIGLGDPALAGDVAKLAKLPHS